MASRGDPQAAKPDVGDILLAIHDFIARSSDELSLSKGDRVELIERDDEFGDGWFLGRHMASGNTGLFPEVYTRTAPKGLIAPSSAPRYIPSPSASSSINGAATGASSPSLKAASPNPSQTGSAPKLPSSLSAGSTPITLPLNAGKSDNKPSAAPPVSLNKSNSIGSLLAGSGRLNNQNQDSPVIHETLTVIDEHITDLHSPPTPGANGLHAATDSGSEYSSNHPERLSYIQGEETDEEEEIPHTRSEVESWSADYVAEYLFTIGVEKQHCEVFRDQEISGEVLLGMDQSSLFLKAFDLGSVGRRLKTWQKIKSLQDEVNGHSGFTTRRNTGSHSDAGSEHSRPSRMRSRTNTLTNSQHISMDERSSSALGKRASQTSKLEPLTPLTPVSQDSPTKPSHQKRPSAASIRDLNHSRRHSSVDYKVSGSTPQLKATGSFPLADTTAHKKQPSFDRNWTMGSASSDSKPGRPVSQEIPHISDPDLSLPTTVDLDRGYFSGTEVESKKRNVLKKRDSLASHSRKSSYADQHRARSATTTAARHSRFGSAEMGRPDSTPTSAAQKYFGTKSEHRRSVSAKTVDSTKPPRPPTKDGPPPPVTKLDSNGVSPVSPTSRQAPYDWLSKPAAQLPGMNGLRAISDAVTRNERHKIGSPGDSAKDSPRSSTPSAGPSFDMDSPEAGKSPLSATTAGSRKSAKKKKKETSAYLRGLQKITPQEAIKDADYSGWMKKKSSHLMTTWKPRLFVLKGRRLAYYYSEDDTEEKGLIDISFHRVLPADNDRLTGLHATITGATNTPAAPTDSNLETLAETQSSPGLVERGADSMFIFKLMPPRAGLTKAVNFTKPTVHYFAVPNLQQGRTWMAALMKATIDRDDAAPLTSTYQQKTISLAKARQQQQRPPALMNLDEKMEESAALDEKREGLGISFGEVDSAISGFEKLGLQRVDSANANKTTPEPEKTEA